MFLTLPPDSNLILARETLPVTTGEGERLLIERGVTRVEFEFVGVAVVALKLGFIFIIFTDSKKYSTSYYISPVEIGLL